MADNDQMAGLTNNAINKMKKEQLQAVATQLLKHSNELLEKLNNKSDDGGIAVLLNEMKAEITEMNETTKTISAENIKLKSSLEVSKTVSNRLSGQVKVLEIQLNKSDQYSRRECLEIVGIPDSISDCDLEDKSLEAFKGIGVSLSPEKVHACHRIGRKDRVIIKLVNRKDVHAILVSKKKLKESDKSKIGLKVNTKVFINESLCPY